MKLFKEIEGINGRGMERRVGVRGCIKDIRYDYIKIFFYSIVLCIMSIYNENDKKKKNSLWYMKNVLKMSFLISECE